MENPKIISIMPVWDEQNMIGLSIASTKDIVYQYIILIQKGIDKTREVVEYCRKLWNLNIIIVESELKLRERKKLAIEMTKSYADYYLLQDGDEIFFTNTESKNDISGVIYVDTLKDKFDFTNEVEFESDGGYHFDMVYINLPKKQIIFTS